MAPATPVPNPASKSSGYDVARPGGVCYVTGQDIPPGTEYHSALRDTEQGLQRVDLLPEAWGDFDKTGVLAHWTGTMPEPKAKKRLLVDDAVLCDLFDRLADAQDEDKLRFRFVVGLILMRKRLLTYDGSEGDTWRLRWSNLGPAKHHSGDVALHDPKLTEQQIADVSANLGDILNGEF